MTFSEDLGNRQYVSQFGTDAIGIEVHKAGALADADANEVTVRMTTLDYSADPVVGSIIFERSALHPATGVYETILASAETATPGLYLTTFSYELDGAPIAVTGIVEIGRASPYYDSLDIGMKGIVESAWLRFADLFDSPNGGPHLQVYFQARFDRNRMAQLLRLAVGRLNTVAQPHSTYTVDDPSNLFPISTWGALLEHALYIETIKHLRRSYVEQPEAVNVTVARQDRRDYLARWGEILRDEEADLKGELDTFKIANMGLGRPRVLVSGGVFGNFGPTRLPGSAAARPRYWSQWY